MSYTRREFGSLVGGTVAAGTLLMSAPVLAAREAQARAASEAAGPILDIADWSYFWFGVERATLARGTVINGMRYSDSYYGRYSYSRRRSPEADPSAAI